MGVVLIAGEVQSKYVSEYFKFLKTFLGRGVFNI